MERAPPPPSPPRAEPPAGDTTSPSPPLTTGPPTQPGTFALFPPGTTPAEAARLAEPFFPLLEAAAADEGDDEEEEDAFVRRLQAAFCRRLDGELALALVRKGPELLLTSNNDDNNTNGSSSSSGGDDNSNENEWVAVARGSQAWTALAGQPRPARLAPWAVEGRGPTLRAAQRDACRRALAALAARGWLALPPLPESAGEEAATAVAPEATDKTTTPTASPPQQPAPRPEGPGTPPQPERAVADTTTTTTPSPPPAVSTGEIQPAPPAEAEPAKPPRRRSRRSRGGGGGSGRANNGGGAGDGGADASAAAVAAAASAPEGGGGVGGQEQPVPVQRRGRGGGGPGRGRRGSDNGAPVDVDDEVVHGRVGRAHKHRVRLMRRSEGNPIVFLDMAAYADDKAPPPAEPSPAAPAQPLPLGRLAIELWSDLVPRAAELARRAVCGDLEPRAGDALRFGSAAEGPTPAAALALLRPRRRGGAASGDKAATGASKEEEEDDDNNNASSAEEGDDDAADEDEGPLGRINYPGQDARALQEDDDLLVGGLVVPASAEPLAPPAPPHAAAAAGVDLSASADVWPRSHLPPVAEEEEEEEEEEKEGGAAAGHPHRHQVPTINAGSDDDDDDDESSSSGDDDGAPGRDAAARRRSLVRAARRLRRALERDVEQSARTAAVVRETLAEAAEEEAAKAKAAKALASAAAAVAKRGAAPPTPAPPATLAPSSPPSTTNTNTTTTPTYSGAYVDFAEPKGWVRFMPLPEHRHPAAAHPPPPRPSRRAPRWYRHHEGMRAFSGSAQGQGSCPLLLHSRPFLLSVAAEELEALAAYYTARDPQASAAAAAAARQQQPNGSGNNADDQPPSSLPEFPGLPSLCVLTGPCHELDDGRVIVGQALAGLGTAREISQGPRERVPLGETGSEFSSRAAMAGGRGHAMRPVRRVVLLGTGQLHPEPVVGGRVLGEDGDGGAATPTLPPAPAQTTAITSLGTWRPVEATAAPSPPSPDDVLASAPPMRDADGLWPLWPEDQPLLPAGRDPAEEVQFRLEVSAALRQRGNELLRQHHQKQKQQDKDADNHTLDLALQAADRYDQARRYLGWTTLRSTGDLTHGQQFALWREETSLALNRAAALLAAGRWSEAAGEAQAAARRSPNDARAHYRLGKAKLELGELVAAEAALAEAARLAPEDRRARAELARCRAARRGRDAALGAALKGAFDKGGVLRVDGGDEEEKKAALPRPPPPPGLVAAARLAVARERPRANPRLKGANSAASLPVHLQNYSWGFDDAEEEEEAAFEEEEEEGGVEAGPSAAAATARSLSPALRAAEAQQQQQQPELSAEELLVAAALASREPVAAGVGPAAPTAAAPTAAAPASAAPAPAQPPVLQPPRLTDGEAARVREMLRGWLEFA